MSSFQDFFPFANESRNDVKKCLDKDGQKFQLYESIENVNLFGPFEPLKRVITILPEMCDWVEQCVSRASSCTAKMFILSLEWL